MSPAHFYQPSRTLPSPACPVTTGQIGFGPTIHNCNIHTGLDPPPSTTHFFRCIILYHFVTSKLASFWKNTSFRDTAGHSGTQRDTGHAGQMTNDQIRMTNESPSPNVQAPTLVIESLGFDWSFGFGHWEFSLLHTQHLLHLLPVLRDLSAERAAHFSSPLNSPGKVIEKNLLERGFCHKSFCASCAQLAQRSVRKTTEARRHGEIIRISEAPPCLRASVVNSSFPQIRLHHAILFHPFPQRIRSRRALSEMRFSHFCPCESRIFRPHHDLTRFGKRGDLGGSNLRLLPDTNVSSDQPSRSKSGSSRVPQPEMSGLIALAKTRIFPPLLP